MNIDTIRSNIESHIGDDILIKYNLGRNKFEKLEVKIIKTYDNIFLVESNNLQKEIKSFSYNDIIMKTIKIDFL